MATQPVNDLYTAAANTAIQVGFGVPSGTPPPSPPPPPSPAPPVGTVITSLTVEDLSSTAGTYPYTAAVRLLPGVVPSTSALQSPDDGTLRAAVLTSHSDGSAALAVVSGMATLTANGSISVRLQSGAPQPGSILTADRIVTLSPSANVSFTWLGGSATATLNPVATPTRVWWASAAHICASWVVPVAELPGICAVFVVHAWANSSRMLVEVTVENSLVNVSSPSDFTPATYSAVVNIGGVSQPAVSTDSAPELGHQGTRAWYARGWIGGSQSVLARMSHTYLQTLPELWNPGRTSTFDFAGYAGDSYVAWGSGRHTNGMGTAGDHISIGPLPQWEARTLQSGGSRAWQATEASALSVLSYNINTRDSVTGLVPTLAAIGTRSQGFGWPRFVPGGGGAGIRGWKTSHCPAAGMMAFYGRPSPVFIEIAQKIAVWSGTESASSNGSFSWTAGVMGYWYQTRGKAWGIRNLGHAALITPSNHPWRASCQAALVRNAQLIGTFRTDSKQKLGVVWNMSPDSPGDHAPNSPHFQFSMFEHHYLAVEMHKLASSDILTGADQVTFEAEADWVCSQPVRWVNERPNGGWRYVPYSVALGPNKTTINSPDTWGQQMSLYNASTNPNGFMQDSPSGVSGPWMSFGNNVANTYSTFGANLAADAYYPAYFWQALVSAVERGVVGASSAYETVVNNITGLDTWLNGFQSDPRWSGVPRGYVVSTWGQGSDVGSISGNIWTPGKDGSGRINSASIASLSPNRWYEVANTRLDSLEPQIVSQLSALGYPGWTDVGTQDWQGVTDAWVGWALDNRPGQEFAYIGPGGGHASSGNNGLYRLNLRTLQWGIELLPSPSSIYPPGYTGDTFYPRVWQDGSPTGLYKSQTPAGVPIGYDEIYDPAFPNDPVRSSRMPTSRHTYTSQVFVPELRTAGAIIMGNRRQWLYDVGAKKWDAPIPMAGAIGPDVFSSAENMTGWWDSVRGRYYMMGNNLSASNEDRCYWWNPTTMAAGTDGNQWPERGNDNGALAAQLIGRDLWCAQYSWDGAPNNRVSVPQRMIRWNLDTQTATYYPITVGSSFNGRSLSNPSPAFAGWDFQSVVWVPSVSKWLCTTLSVLPNSSWDDAWAWIDPQTWTLELVNEPAGEKNWCFTLENKVTVVDGLVIALAKGTRNIMVMRPA